MSGIVNLQPGNLAPDYCFTTFQQLNNDIINATTATLAGTLNSFNIGNTTPAVIDQDKPWFRLNADGSPDRWYVFRGLWLSKHYLPPDTIQLFPGSAADIDTFDGGEVAPVTSTTGPFWERFTPLDARSPIGPGTLPSTIVIAPGDNLGEETHQLSIPEMPSHTHAYPTTDGAQFFEKVTSNKTDTLNRTGSFDIKVPADPLQNTGGDAMGITLGHNNIGPSYGIFFIKRSSRLFYRI